ncbi:hypothetical protein F0562_029671 [Nyssa sinensis]|uniref:Uncharacterized protein n=1 Tax=Nyssa sinensis TaxID=561372 RepID=A0A5J5B5X2_9ASTE|nr:hypothetical protein F0562_029671 [Nyssa sinensis]
MWMGVEEDNNIQVESEQEGNISNLEDGSLGCVLTGKELMMVLEQGVPIVLGFYTGVVNAEVIPFSSLVGGSNEFLSGEVVLRSVDDSDSAPISGQGDETLREPQAYCLDSDWEVCNLRGKVSNQGCKVRVVMVGLLVIRLVNPNQG